MQIPTTDLSDCYTPLLTEMGRENILLQKNPRLRKSWRIEKRGREWRLVVPPALAEAPAPVFQTLLEWAKIHKGSNLQKSRLSNGCRATLKKFERTIWEHLLDRYPEANLPKRRTPQKQFKCAAGVSVDLYALFSEINETWFNGELSSFLRWGRYGSKTSYHSTFVDENHKEHHLITIAGIYNHHQVPLFAIRSVLYHEMLHIYSPPIKKGERRVVHHSEFRRLEQLFPEYEEWQRWLKKKAPQLLKRMNR